MPLNLVYPSSPDEFKSFLDIPWHHSFNDLTFPHFEKEVTYHYAKWRGAIDSFRQPHAWFEIMDKSFSAWMNGRDLFVVQCFKAFMDAHNDKKELSKRHLKKLRQEFQEIINRQQQVLQNDIKLHMEQYWDVLTKNDNFKLQLRDCIHNAYSSLWSGYEDYVTSILGKFIRTGKPRDRAIRSVMENLLSTDIWWTDKAINEIRCVRNSIEHAGGRMTPELYEIDYKKYDGEDLQLTTMDVRDCYDILKKNIYDFSVAAIKYKTQPIPQNHNITKYDIDLES